MAERAGLNCINYVCVCGTRPARSGFFVIATSHWPEDYKTILLQTAVSRQQLLDSITALDFDRHSPAFKLVGMGLDIFAGNSICEEVLEVWGDANWAVSVLEKQTLFVERYYETTGPSMETLGTMWSGGMARLLVSGLPDLDTIRD